MKVEIWSDIVCPFCYIGKRRFEQALEKFPHADNVEVVWRSFELTPDYRPIPGRNVYESLAEKKGIPVAKAKEMSDYMADMAKEVGLKYDFDNAVPTNTFLGHQLIHLAAKHGKQGEAKERLMAGYYLQGQDLNDVDTLVKLATEIGLDAEEARAALLNGTYAEEVRHDEYQAQQINVRGVPFFVFEDKYAVSGAQPTELFSEVLEKVWDEFQPTKPAPIMVADGPACGPDGCEI
ncbi:disulfide bond formation protein DsbA [Hymenobacter sedentarius]|uniref:Disulfide bond formation protein DsbA n=1 Tax=Hymenobacter sedentarius TaxID=1411621 RepID=A0A0U4ATJ3_9BACT|nr:DsbA family oxidoreductase [Hymenobacter sedentarius]ALW84077.1 disulfide bond formation protein DsbA [Hymenobacter sedentarius]